MSGHEERARALFLSGYNCSQAVFCAFSKEMGLSDKTAFALSGPFGGGMGRLRLVCGALSGAFMTLGHYFGDYPPGSAEGNAALYAHIRAFASLFEKETGSLFCAALLRKAGLDPSPGGEPGARTDDFYIKRKVCIDCVALSARLLEHYLSEHSEEYRKGEQHL